jgi:hypothetical protein
MNGHLALYGALLLVISSTGLVFSQMRERLGGLAMADATEADSCLPPVRMKGHATAASDWREGSMPGPFHENLQVGIVRWAARMNDNSAAPTRVTGRSKG